MAVPMIGALRRVAAPDADEALYARVAEAEPRAVAEVYDRYHRQVRAFARRVLGDDAAAEDVVQEVFVALPKAIRRFRRESSLGTYLVAIAARRCHKQRRSMARRLAAMGRLAKEPVQGQAPDPEREANRQRLAEVLQRGIDTLSMGHRMVFVLAAVEERTSPEVADILGIPEGTVRTRLFHARKRLRAFLEKEGVG
ncbi:MAG: RNA polymerase sigma factor [Sandaracinaceae bacterium]